MDIWVGMLDVRPGPDGTGGAYVYCAARAGSECGPFELGEFAFVAEMQFPDDAEPELGWAYDGDIARAPALFARAAEVAARDE